MEEVGNSLQSRDVLEPDKSEAGLEMAQSILSKFSMKSLFGFTSKLDPLDPEEEDAVLKAFRSLEVHPASEQDDPSEGSDQPQAEAPVPPDLENDGKSARAETGSEGSQGKARASTSPPAQKLLSPAVVSVDGEDVIWVRGTLVHTTSDSDSEDESQETEGGGLDTRESTTAVSSEPSQEPKERRGDSGENDDTRETDDSELCGDSQGTLSETSNKLDPGYHPAEHSHGQDQAEEERSQIPPAARDQTASVTEKPVSKREREAPGEKSFQLPAFFSGLRVLKKGATAEAGETITEIKPKDGDLALLKLTQPVHKSLVQGGPQTVKSQGRATDPKATPTLLEQLSQLLNFDMPRTELKEADPEFRGADEMGTEQESQKSSGDAQVQGGQVKSKPPETALEAFKALFIRPPKKGSTADTSELEALKRKMRHEKESLRAVFERSKSRPADSPSDPKSPDQSPTEQDDRTPGRLQAVWPPPKTKDTEEKVGLKYTEAGNVKGTQYPGMNFFLRWLLVQV
ncbi:formin-1 isoform X3 [Sigmodon hispidus]